MINLNKQEILLFLHKIKEDEKHFNKYLFYKFQYFYGRRSQEIASLRIDDIDFDKKEITFDLSKKKEETKLTLILPDAIVKDIKKQIANKEQDFLFVEDKIKINALKRNMRMYLERNSNKIIDELVNKDITLNTHDFRRLRGQHLYLAGYDLEIIQSLYAHNSLDQTVEYLQIKEIEVNKMLLDDMK
ncbi:tyrosine-type recombinase/integrase [Methanobrevibacter sp. DSM 116169]|uniref:tyrosine-type recombinase/integrase n=1 Tax=Methanobrevibacter sp. DSM 116169 TaxID=3242727 RepID=UPI0038FC2F25